MNAVNMERFIAWIEQIDRSYLLGRKHSSLFSPTLALLRRDRALQALSGTGHKNAIPQNAPAVYADHHIVDRIVFDQLHADGTVITGPHIPKLPE